MPCLLRLVGVKEQAFEDTERLTICTVMMSMLIAIFILSATGVPGPPGTPGSQGPPGMSGRCNPADCYYHVSQARQRASGK